MNVSSSDALFHGLIQHGIQRPAQTNQSALIKKILAQFASDFVVFRELIQNSDDAQAKTFQLQFICDPASDLTNNQRQTKSIRGNIGKFFRRRPQNNTASSKKTNEQTTDHPEWKFHNKTITEIRTLNDGLVFTEADWKRVITIADGNPNEDAIGQFGVGFFTVFSYSDKPMILSGKQCLGFGWKDDESLITFRSKLPVEARSSMTSVILIMRDKYVLDTKSTNDLETEQSVNASPSSRTNAKVIPTINLTRLKYFFLKVLSFTKNINELTITIDGETVFQVKKSQKSISRSQTTLNFRNHHPVNNNHMEMLHFRSFIHTDQRYEIADGPSITLDYIDVTMTVNIDEELHDQIRAVIRKSLPSTIHIKLLIPSKDILQNLQSYTSKDNNLHNQILNSIIPLKFENNKILPCGEIFIGLATHQSIGLGMHVHSQFIPTVDRENLDFQNPYAQQWNEQIIESIGKFSRLIYDQLILDKSQDYNSLLAMYSFLPTTPAKNIGHILFRNFISSEKNLFVPVKQTPSATQVSLVPSLHAWLSNSELISLFLSKPLVPFDLEKNDFFIILRRHRLINDIDYSTIIVDIRKSIFLSNEFVKLLHWLCTKEVNNKLNIQRVFSSLRFRETNHSSIITLNKLEFYDGFKISPDLPLPSNILPSNIASHLSREQLNKKLFLSEVPLEHILNFYIDRNEQHKLFCEEKTSICLLTFISQHWNRCNESTQKRIKILLSQFKCIPTTKGMQLPSDSYIYSESLARKNLPIIAFNTTNVSKTEDDISSEKLDNVVSNEFLKEIGCRTIITGDGRPTDSSLNTSSNSESNREYIQKYLKIRDKLSGADFEALKQSKSLIGRTLDATAGKTGTYVPRDLHFPSLENELDWPALLILDWPDIDPHSPEHRFLKELGVREVPELDKLMDRIVEEHQQASMIVKDYEVSTAMSFLVNNFHKHYIKLWNDGKSQQEFLPCYYSTKMLDPTMNTNECAVFLSAPNNVFTDEGPLFPTPIPAVIELFKLHCDISLISVKKQPTLDAALKTLIQTKKDILTTQTASKLFAYLNTLEGLNRNLIKSISEYAFIPLQDQNTFGKPTEVFLHSNNSLDESNTDGLIDYVDYGPDANSFLRSIGVLHNPPAKILAKLLLDRQAKYFSNSKDNSDNRLPIKLQVYTVCLKKLASDSTFTTQLHNDPLRSRLMTEPWCLGYRTVPGDPHESKRSEIVKPDKIYLNDDEQYATVLKPLCAPEEPELAKLYEQYGAKWLSESVKRTLLRQGQVTSTKRSSDLRDLIQYRLNILFVNKRGEKMLNVDEQRIKMLSTNLSVYETEAIQCQLTFQNETTILDPTECSSCVLECANNKVEIFIQKSSSNFEYFDIANELARFIFKKANEDIIDAISNKLSSSLEVLRRRGIPVSRLLNESSKEPITQHQSEVVKRKANVPEQKSKKSPRQLNNISGNDSEKIPRAIIRIPNFNERIRTCKNLLSSIIQQGEEYTQSKVHSSSCDETEVPSKCETLPIEDMTRYKNCFHSIPLFVEQNVHVTENMADSAKQLASVLVGLATHVFNIPINTINLFRDINGNKVAFNQNGSMFFNLRYFEQVFADKMNSVFSSSSHSVVTNLVNFYYVVTCHELTHHVHKKHDLSFLSDMETLIVGCLPKKDKFLEEFFFTDYF